MRKAKLTLVFEKEYEINPDNYPEGVLEDEMLEYDMLTTINDPETFMEMCEPRCVSVKGEFIK